MHPMDEIETPDMNRENPEVKREMSESEAADWPAERITR